MIPTYIYEIAIEVHGEHGTEFKEFFLESFQELAPGYHSGMVFGRTEQKSNSFYFTCLTAKQERTKFDFKLKFYTDKGKRHRFHDLVDSVIDYIGDVGFVLDKDKARLIFYIEILKKLILTINKSVNVDHSLYFGAPGIGKSVALNLLHNALYSNAGSISGPRFSLPGLTGGQREVIYQDLSKKKNVPGLFSNQAFVFDEINNSQFIDNDMAVNLFKSVALSQSGTSSTVGGKEFPRIALIAGTANYDMDHLTHYENKVKKLYNREKKAPDRDLITNQPIINDMVREDRKDIPIDFDFFKPMHKYGIEVPMDLKMAMLKIRDSGDNYLTGFPKPLMERFYWAVLVDPKYDRKFLKNDYLNVYEHLKSRNSKYSKRELLSQLYIHTWDDLIKDTIKERLESFNDPAVEKRWSKEVQDFLGKMRKKYTEFFSMFHRLNEVHVFALYSLTLINNENYLSTETKHLYEKLISLVHTPIDMSEFHNPDFEKFTYIGESKKELLELIKEHPNTDLNKFIDLNRITVDYNLKSLLTAGQIRSKSKNCYELTETAEV
jgi:hypothetical protein